MSDGGVSPAGSDGSLEGEAMLSEDENLEGGDEGENLEGAALSESEDELAEAASEGQEDLEGGMELEGFAADLEIEFGESANEGEDASGAAQSTHELDAISKNIRDTQAAFATATNPIMQKRLQSKIDQLRVELEAKG
jgi:TATA-binding protein-associated factor Taf7